MNTNVKSNLNVRIDSSVKDRAGALLMRMGIDHTTAIEMFYRQIINENGLPFTPKPVVSVDEQLLSAFRSRTYSKEILETNEKGDVIVDRAKDPALYDFAVNG
ncbi:MAG: type II toxin-antitoxin system RelB/DinJ family antitoxin [Oscillospiraceae bacterium]|jgi:DNA-damage-inducible protein J|nr:type II toxin-antitoxin system RelB/DinJ family antitoxin [Oscillospiraceae bacterium]